MLEPNRQGEVWVYAEQEDGSLHDVVLELCGKARELADRLGALIDREVARLARREDALVADVVDREHAAHIRGAGELQIGGRKTGVPVIAILHGARSSNISCAVSVVSSTAVIWLVSLTRLMNRIAASTMPISTATVRSMTTVRPKAVRKTAASLRGHLGSRLKLCHSPMLRATLTSTALSVASGMNFASGAATRMMASNVTA